jgi:hypothetical protein
MSFFFFLTQVFNMDLFAPKKDQNKYGARTKKNLKLGEITSTSYIPNGLTAAQYKKVREGEKATKDKNYQKNVAKAFKFNDFTDFYLKRGTSEGGNWLNAPGKGHTFTKTKYDYSGTGTSPYKDAKTFESFTSSSIFGGKKTAKKSAKK